MTSPEGERFGNTWTVLRVGVIAMAILGTVLAAILTGVELTHHTLEQHWPILLVPVIVFPGVFLLVGSPSLLFSIWVGGGRVRHLFLDRYVLSDLPAADFERMTIRTGKYGPAVSRFGFSPADVDNSLLGWGPVLHFKHDRCIRLIGVHMRILQALKIALEEASR